MVTNNVAQAMLDQDPYEIKVVIGYMNNFVFSCTGTERWEQAMEKLPFSIINEYFVNQRVKIQYFFLINRINLQPFSLGSNLSWNQFQLSYPPITALFVWNVLCVQSCVKPIHVMN